MTPAQESLLAFMRGHQRVPTTEEAVDLYAAHALRYDGLCVETNIGKKILEYRYAELKQRADLWLKHSIGSLVVQGYLQAGTP
jgi:hypothetical protein